MSEQATTTKCSYCPTTGGMCDDCQEQEWLANADEADEVATPAGRVAEGERIYATAVIRYLDEHVVMPADEGVVTQLTGFDDLDLLIEWDAGFIGGANSGTVAPVRW